MINVLRRSATAIAALAVIGSAGAGVASAATPAVAEPAAQSSTMTATADWFDPLCIWGGAFNWHYYSYCDSNYWHGSHFHDWQRFDYGNHGYDYGWRHH